MYINRLTEANSFGRTFIVLGRGAGHTGLDESLWQCYAENYLKEKCLLDQNFNLIFVFVLVKS